MYAQSLSKLYVWPLPQRGRFEGWAETCFLNFLENLRTESSLLAGRRRMGRGEMNNRSYSA